LRKTLVSFDRAPPALEGGLEAGGEEPGDMTGVEGERGVSCPLVLLLEVLLSS